MLVMVALIGCVEPADSDTDGADTGADLTCAEPWAYVGYESADCSGPGYVEADTTAARPVVLGSLWSVPGRWCMPFAAEVHAIPACD